MRNFALKVYQFFNGCVSQPGLENYRLENSNGDRLVQVQYDHPKKKVILLFDDRVWKGTKIDATQTQQGRTNPRNRKGSQKSPHS
jgi:hypothetical protein